MALVFLLAMAVLQAVVGGAAARPRLVSSPVGQRGGQDPCGALRCYFPAMPDLGSVPPGPPPRGPSSPFPEFPAPAAPGLPPPPLPSLPPFFGSVITDLGDDVVDPALSEGFD